MYNVKELHFNFNMVSLKIMILLMLITFVASTRHLVKTRYSLLNLMHQIFISSPFLTIVLTHSGRIHPVSLPQPKIRVIPNKSDVLGLFLHM